MKKILLFSAILYLFTCSLNSIAMAQEVNGIELKPYIIDEKTRARDILKYVIKLKNNTDKKVELYAIVNDVSKDEGKMIFKDPATMDLNTRAARWFKIRRNKIELMPKEEKEESLEIEIPPRATPGKYCVVLSFPDGSNGYEAEAKANGIVPKITINLEIVEQIVEKAVLNYFKAEKNVFLVSPCKFSFSIENIGGETSSPTGFLRIYNRRGEEVQTIAIPEKKIEPGKKEVYYLDWANNAAGKYKAKLEVEYGEKDKRDLQDMTFFWMLPKNRLIVFFVLVILCFSFLVILLYRKLRYFKAPVNKVIQRSNEPGVLDLKNKD